MNKTEAKNQLIDKIREIEDLELIKEIYRLLEIDAEEDVYITSDGQKKAIDEALKQIENGETLTEEEEKRQTKEWLKRKS